MFIVVFLGLTMTLTAYIMYYHINILLLVIELLFLTLHEASLICLFQVPQYNYFNNFNVILMETSVSPRLNIVCIMFKIMAFFIITLFAGLHDMRLCSQGYIACDLFAGLHYMRRCSQGYITCEGWNFTRMWKTLT